MYLLFLFVCVGISLALSALNFELVPGPFISSLKETWEQYYYYFNMKKKGLCQLIYICGDRDHTSPRWLNWVLCGPDNPDHCGYIPATVFYMYLYVHQLFGCLGIGT